MATVITLPTKREAVKKDSTERMGVKPVRSMTYPLRESKPAVAKHKVKQGEPFDPEDLTRRLQAHLIEQRKRAERRRDVRAAKVAAAHNGEEFYHHVPKVAAAQFERTATPDMMRKTPKLGQTAIKAHLEQLKIDDHASAHAPISLKKTQAMDQAIIERDFLRTRNQLQCDQMMEEAAEVDVYRDTYKPTQRTFNTDFSHLKVSSSKRRPRPLSTGDELLVPKDDSADGRAKPRSPGFKTTDRNDWAQRDDDIENRTSKKEKGVESIRKKSSSWILLGKKSPKLDKEEISTGIGDSGSSPDGSKNGRANFLARFKRHPS